MQESRDGDGGKSPSMAEELLVRTWMGRQTSSLLMRGRERHWGEQQSSQCPRGRGKEGRKEGSSAVDGGMWGGGRSRNGAFGVLKQPHC